MYHSIEPYDRGLLDVEGGEHVYWESYGNPLGRPAVYLHGGPGSGCSAQAARFFDPQAYRIVLVDQRGCGRSRPLPASRNDLRSNTTHCLIEDLERLRAALSIDHWTVVGVSWGSTLALAYAQTYPERVSGIVLACVTTTSRREVRWLTEGVRAIFPEYWSRFSSFVPRALRDVPLVDAYAELLFDEDPSACDAAAREWCAWESAHVSLAPPPQQRSRFDDPEFRLRFSRLVTHYWRHAAFLEDEQLIENAPVLNGIPGALIHGRYDVSSPLETAWRLNRRWMNSTLQVVDDAGHGGGAMPEAIVAALDRFRR